MADHSKAKHPDQPNDVNSREAPPFPAARPRSSGHIIILLILMFIIFWSWQRDDTPYISYTRFKKELEAGNIERLMVQGETIEGALKNPIPLHARSEVAEEDEQKEIDTFHCTLPPFEDPRLMEQIMGQEVTLTSRDSGAGLLQLILINSIPFFLILALIIWISRGMAKKSGSLLSIGRARARRFEKKQSSVTFRDVAGVKEAKEGLEEIITFLREPERFRKLGCRVPKGVLLAGPPGTGKTLLARAVAGEAGVPFYSITGSDFVEMFVGVGASRVRDLFQLAKNSAPCIIFLDELDSVGRHRGAGLGGGHDEREQTLNQFLSEIDGFEPTDNLVVLAATNRPDVLDPALLRPGRFDRRVTVDLPVLKERIEILRVHARKVPIGDDVDFAEIAASMPGRSGADLGNLINESALLAAKHGRHRVGRKEITEARERILMGQLRGGIVLQGEEKRAVAVHEAGHALVAHLTSEADPVEKVSIIPRGSALGATQQLPEERYNYTREFMVARLNVMLAGRAAEQVFLGTVSTGAANDLVQASSLARRMAGQWGMSDKFRNIAFDDHDQQQVFLGQQLTTRREYSEQTARDIDMEIKALIDQSYEQAETLIRNHREQLQHLAEALARDEVLEGEALKTMLQPRLEPQHAG